MPHIPKPTSRTAREALFTIGHYWRTGGDPRRLFEVSQAYRTWGQITGTYLRPGHRSGAATRAERFCDAHPPPSPLRLDFDRFKAKKTGKTWRVPFICDPRDPFVMEFTVIKGRANWRVRFPRGTSGRVPNHFKAALVHALGLNSYPTTPLGRWSPAPPHALQAAPPYVRQYLEHMAQKSQMPDPP